MAEIVSKKYILENLENYNYFNEAINHNKPELSFLSDEYLPTSQNDELEKYHWYFHHFDGASVILAENSKKGFKENYIIITGRKDYVENTKLNLEQKIGKLVEA